MAIPRSEHPQPQMERNEWMNLNGEWEFEEDPGCSGKERKIYERTLGQTIRVPFCPESELSGIGKKDFMDCVWYRKCVKAPEDWKGGRLLLHFGAVDYQADVYINGSHVGTHRGGYSSFCMDVTDYWKRGEENVIAVCAEDHVRSGSQPRGKQSALFFSHECDYTRTTGIWQTVWLEHVPKQYIRSVKYYPDAQNGQLVIQAVLEGEGTLEAEAFYQGKPMGKGIVICRKNTASLTIPLKEKHLWDLGDGKLYDLILTFGTDEVKSYFGLRDIAICGMHFKLNGRIVFQRLVLDQGFYPDGIYTAPDEEALIRDIQLSMDAGFNGARLHQKIFEPRFLYHCDRMGYLVWGEHASWGLDLSDAKALGIFLPEWVEAVERDFNHPAIVGWCPFNETWDYEGRKQMDIILETVYRVTKALDPTRPCIDTSGSFHVRTDIFDVHDYEQDPAVWRERYDKFKDGVLVDRFQDRQTYRGEPSFVSEYGGIKWDVDQTIASWGYGNAPKTEEEYMARYEGLTTALMENERFLGFCYTQLYDVEQEKNGIYTYDRKKKFDLTKIREVNQRKAACEREEKTEDSIE